MSFFFSISELAFFFFKKKGEMGSREDLEFSAFSVNDFVEELREQCRGWNGDAEFFSGRLTNESMEKLARALLIVFSGSQGTSEYHKDDDSPLTLKKLYLGDNDFGDLGLVALARALSHLPCCRETLEELKVDVNKHLTTLAPLADAGVLKGLKHLWAGNCSLSGDEGVLPPELCANLPALEYLNLCWNEGGATVTLTAEALCALPAGCKVVLRGSRVQVARPSAEDGEMGLVALPTAYGEEFGGDDTAIAKTVAEICAFAGVQRVTLVKPARA